MVEKYINISNKNETEAGHTTKRERRFGRAAAKLLAIGALTTVTAMGVNHLVNGGENQPNPEHFGQLDPSITQIHLDEGATLRSAPFTDQIDNATSVRKIDKSRDVETADGVYVTDNENGKWYGISVSDMKVDLNAGIVTVWVNEQTATPVDE